MTHTFAALVRRALEQAVQHISLENQIFSSPISSIATRARNHPINLNGTASQAFRYGAGPYAVLA